MKLVSFLICTAVFSLIVPFRSSAQELRPDDPIVAALDSLDLVKFFQNNSFSADREKLNIYKFPPDSIPEYPEEVYRKRLAKLDALSPFGLVYNETVRAYIDLYAKKRRNHTSRMLGLSQLYFPMYEEKLANHGLPLELKYLSIIESALNPTAKSRAGAGGLWQFMYRTGLNYGLEVNSYVDERFNPELSTEAACRLLKNLYGMYKDWSLALAAYNAGPGNVNKAIRRAGGVMDYWAIRPYLPQETQGYVPAFIAVTYVMSYHREHNIFPVQPKYFNYEIDSVFITANVTFEQISKIVSMPVEDIRFLNPMYVKDLVPGSAKPYPLYLPRKVIGEFMANERLLYESSDKKVLAQPDSVAVKNADFKEEVSKVPVEAKKITYKVQRGDYISLIARKFQVRVSDIMEWNNLKSEVLYVGQELVIHLFEPSVRPQTQPAAKPVVVVQPTPPPTPRPTNQYRYYTVKPGDTLYGIARKYNVSVADLMKWNDLKSKVIKSGQKLKIKLHR